jgi:hypothetical protein
MAEVLPEKRREDAPERWHPLQDLDSVVERMRQILDKTFAGISRWPASYADFWCRRSTWICRLRLDPRTRAYASRRAADGLSKRETIRCLKRYIARETYHLLTDPSP